MKKKQEDVDIINKRYAERCIKFHQKLITCINGEHYEEAAKIRDSILDDTEATAQFNSVMSGAKIEDCRQMLRENNQFIFDELNNK